MSDPAFITDEEWDRIHKYIAEGPAHVHLDTNDQGTMVVFKGGVMHPRAYLQIMDDDFDPTDIWKDVKTPSPTDPIGIMPGSLSGHTLRRWKPNKVEPE